MAQIYSEVFPAPATAQGEQVLEPLWVLQRFRYEQFN